MADKIDGLLINFQNKLQSASIDVKNLSTIARYGDDKLVEKFMTENVFLRGDSAGKTPDVLANHLYVACFWGFRDIVKELLELNEQGIAINVDHQNKSSLWTPLHAATFQEFGPIIMMLLEAGAQPELPDLDGRTPKDFASASDKVWGHFAQLGLQKTSRSELHRMGILKKVEGESRVQSAAGSARSREGSARSIRMAQYQRGDSVGALLGGDVLANDNQVPGKPTASNQPMLTIYK